jgi:HlyD family secretion protein
MRRGLVAIVGLFVIGGGWAALAPLDAGVSAPAQVVVSGNRQTVQHREGGSVRQVRVKDGARVEKGDILIELAAGELKSRERALIGQVIELETLRARLLAEAAGELVPITPPNFSGLPTEYAEQAAHVLQRQEAERATRTEALRSQFAVIRQRGAQLRLRIVGLEKQLESAGQQTALVQAELGDTRSLADRGLMPTTQVRSLERVQAELGGRQGEIEASIQEARKAIGESDLQAIALRENRAQEVAFDLRETEARLADVSPRADAVREELERSLIRAPVSGVVVGLRVFGEGGVVRPGEPILDIVPQDQPLVLHARIDPRDADDLLLGMTTEVRFSAFTGRHQPRLTGRITQLSADRLTEERSGAGYFQAEVTVPAAEVAALDAAGMTLKAGLPADIVVPLRKRSALQFLLEPLDRSLWKSFRQN